jgi:HK97 family phage portal protein
MKVLGLPIPFTGKREKALSAVDQSRGGWLRIMESFAGAWQKNITLDYNTVLSNHADFACKTLIASDIAKLRIKLVQRQPSGIWSEVPNTSYTVLVKPNHFQSRIQFIECWVTSKLQSGNAYILKQRAPGGNVVGLYVLDPCRVRPLIADNGDVFYELQCDRLAGIESAIVVPAREIIHDRFNCLFHQLVGISPIFAAGLAATHGVSIQQQATKFFQNGARPGGILTAPGAISDDTAKRLKEYWDNNFSGANAGKVAVLGDALKYEALSASAEASQLVEQLQWTAQVVCSVYHVPPYKIGIGDTPANSNVQSLNVEYFSQALQILIESIEVLLDDGLGLRGENGQGANLGTEIDVDNLLRMDSSTQMDVIDKGKNTLTPNESRRKLDLPPVDGGDTVYRQQQDFSLSALSKRDASENPFQTSGTGTAAPTPETVADGTTDVQATALNGAQVTALQMLLDAVAAGNLPPETARAAIAAAFPLIPKDEIDQMIDPLVDFEPAEPAEPSAPNPPPAKSFDPVMAVKAIEEALAA